MASVCYFKAAAAREIYDSVHCTLVRDIKVNVARMSRFGFSSTHWSLRSGEPFAAIPLVGAQREDISRDLIGWSTEGCC